MEIKNRDKGSIRRVLIPFPRILLNLGISRIFDSISFGFFFFELRLRFLNLGISKIFDSISFDFFFFELCLFLGFLNFGNL